MSALGQKRTCAAQNAMSALPPKADICSALASCPLSAISGHVHVGGATSLLNRHTRVTDRDYVPMIGPATSAKNR